MRVPPPPLDSSYPDSLPSPRSLVGCVPDLRTGGCWFVPLARPIFFPKIDYSHSEIIHSSPTTEHCFDDDYVEKQPVAWKKNIVRSAG